MTAVIEHMVEQPEKPTLKGATTAKGIKKATRKELLDLIEKMQQDWVQLNIFLNATAVNYSWCSDYESRLGRYNSQFQVLRLQGRAHQSVSRSGNTAYTLAQTVIAALRIKHVKVQARLDDVSKENLAKSLWNMSYPHCNEYQWDQMSTEQKRAWRSRADVMLQSA